MRFSHVRYIEVKPLWEIEALIDFQIDQIIALLKDDIATGIFTPYTQGPEEFFKNEVLKANDISECIDYRYVQYSEIEVKQYQVKGLLRLSEFLDVYEKAKNELKNQSKLDIGNILKLKSK